MTTSNSDNWVLMPPLADRIQLADRIRSIVGWLPDDPLHAGHGYGGAQWRTCNRCALAITIHLLDGDG